MYGESVQQVAAIGLQLAEQPGEVILASMVGAVGQIAPAVQAAVLLVVAAVKVAAPAPFFRTYDERVWIGATDLRAVVLDARQNLVHGGAGRVHVTMRGVPDAVLVVQDVVARRGAGGQAPFVHHRLHPLLLIGGTAGDVGVVGIVARHVLPGGLQNAVAGIGEPLGVVAGLSAVFGLRKTGELGAAGPQLGHPVEHGNGDHGARAGRLGVGDERVATLACDAAGVADAFKIPILVTVVGVQLPIVAAAVVAAVAVERNIEVGKLRGGAVGDAVDARIDGPPVGVGVDGNAGRGILGGSNARQRNHEDRGPQHSFQGLSPKMI